jgi:pyruvate dehydrogenase (quinone)
VEDPDDGQDALSKAFAHPGPAVVDVVIDPNALSIPRDAAVQHGFGGASVNPRTISPVIRKMIDLARANLRNTPRP